ncbi:hypothetical protein HIM_00087 [Hirsutella minnesotensis 3608]|nr:hypothetical protein HIM_00087 [Hirsutella minnesotensis 3608]
MVRYSPSSVSKSCIKLNSSIAQAPQAPAGKRKRGRPRRGQEPDTQQQLDASRDEQNGGNDATQEAAHEDRPKKRGKTAVQGGNSSAGAEIQARRRGRPRQSLDGQQQLERENEAQEKRPRRKQKSQQEPQEEQDQSHPEATTDVPRRKRGRPSLQKRTTEADSDPPEDATQDAQPSQRRKRRRAGDNDAREERDATRDEVTEEPDRGNRRRGRPAKSDAAPSQAQESAPKKNSKNLSRGEGQTRDQNDTVGEARQRKRGRRQRQEQVQQPPEAEPEARSRSSPARGADAQSRARKKQRRGKTDAATEPTEQPVAALPKNKKRASETSSSRRQTNEEDQAGASSAEDRPPSPRKPYAHVVAQVRRVRPSTITAKWSPLGEPSLSAVSSLLHLAHQPILQRLSGTNQRRAHASAALHLMMRRIARKVARGLPFPPAAMPSAPATRAQQPTDGGREVELDFESVLDGAAALEARLGPAAHAVELLRREKEYIERELERDYETLRNLEASARAQAREQRGLLKKAHVLTPLVSTSDPSHDEQRESSALTTVGNVFTELDDDPELRQLASQLAGHVESIRTNLQQTEGLLPQLAAGRAALQAALLKHLNPAQYERVVLG